VLGGEQQLDGTDTILDYAAIFDATTETWLPDGSMINLHDDFAIAPLDTCFILIIDGGVPLLGQEAPSTHCETLEVTLPDACRIGDLNNDTEVDVHDLRTLAFCMTGPDADWLNFRCWPADLDVDFDADLRDAAVLLRQPTEP
jgi:hypothetical protein